MNLDGDKASDAIGKFFDMLGGLAQAPSVRRPPQPEIPSPKAMRGRRSNPDSPPISPMPLSPRMTLLRNLAEDMHARWAAGERAVPEERLGAASQSDLGILCALLVDCAHPMERRALVSWLEASLSEERIDIIPHGATGGKLEDGEFLATSAMPADALACAARKAAADRHGAELARISSRFIALSEDANQLHMDWIEGDREAVRGYLRQAPRVDLGILCALINERANPLRRQEFVNWLEANLVSEQQATAISRT